MLSLRAFLLPAVLLAVVAVSGCTNLPFLGGGGVTYDNDIVVIRELTAIPQTIGKGQTVRVLAYVENLGEKSIGTQGAGIAGEITVDLYDYCQGLFTIQPQGSTFGPSSGGVVPGGMLPKETKLIEWVLKPADTTKLTTKCPLKVAVRYPYHTDGVTSISFIDENEMKRQLEQGSFKPVSSFIARGFGPIKAWFDVRDQQPVPAIKDGVTPVLLQIENYGSGFLAGSGGVAEIAKDEVVITLDTELKTTANCRWTGGGPYNVDAPVRLIKSKAPAILCEVGLADPSKVEKDATKQMQVAIDYVYEFRKEVQVTVEAS